MNLAQIRQECWDIARETSTSDGDRLWTKSEMNSYINRTYRHIARETRCIRDDITYRITSAPYASYAAMTALVATNSYVAEDVARMLDPASWFYVNPDPAGTYTARLDSQAQTIWAFQ